MDPLLKIACIQSDCEPGNVTANLDRALRLVEAAQAGGARMAVLPELCNVGYDLNRLKNSSYDSLARGFEQSRDRLAAASRRLAMVIAAGLLETENGRYYNSLLVFDGEAVPARYRKLALFPLSGETEFFDPGDRLVTFRVDGFRLGIMICFDIRFPEIARKYLEEDCSGLIIASAFPSARLDHWQTLVKSRAVENQLYVAAANRSGADNGLRFAGNSCVIDPWGTVKASAAETGDAVIVHEMDLRNVSDARDRIPTREGRDYLRTVLNGS